jgi:flap endonuclease-1
MTRGQFVDLCILLGCDFTSKIKGIGPKTAPKLIRDHKNIETVLAAVGDGKVPDNFQFEVRIFSSV